MPFVPQGSMSADSSWRQEEGVLEFRQVERIWNSVVSKQLDTSLAARLDDITAVACGFTYSVFYSGNRVMCDKLIQAANEQISAMKTIRAFTHRTSPIFCVLFPSHELLYLRQVEAREYNDPLISLPSKPVSFVALGHREAILDISARINALITDELLVSKDS